MFIELSVYSPTSPHYGHGQDPISSSRKGEERERGSRGGRIAKEWQRSWKGGDEGGEDADSVDVCRRWSRVRDEEQSRGREEDGDNAD